jgi:hypothetical protein
MLFSADGFDADAILDQADPVPLPVAFIEALDRGAGKRRTLKAKINFIAGSAVFYLALPAMFRFAGILSAAAETGLFFLEMNVADGAGHPAWSEHV